MENQEKAKITLRHPFDHDGARIASVTMRRPLVRDLRAAQGSAGPGASDAEVELAMFSNLCEMAPETWDAMDLGDYRQVQRAYEGFLFRGSTSGPRARS